MRLISGILGVGLGVMDRSMAVFSKLAMRIDGGR